MEQLLRGLPSVQVFFRIDAQHKQVSLADTRFESDTPFPVFFVGIYALLMTEYNWTSSFGWWSILFGLFIVYSLAIPDYLVEDKKKKKHSIWRKKHLSSELKKTPV